MKLQPKTIELTDFSFFFSIKNYLLCFSRVIPYSSTILTNITENTIFLKLNPSDIFNDISNLRLAKILEVTISIRKCRKGEYFDLGELKCIECQPNFYSFEDNFLEPSSCKSCTIERRFYCYGGFNLTPKAGYWRRSSDSINFIKCPYEAGKN